MTLKTGDDEDEYAEEPFWPPGGGWDERGRVLAESPAGRAGGIPPLSSGRRVIAEAIIAQAAGCARERAMSVWERPQRARRSGPGRLRGWNRGAPAPHWGGRVCLLASRSAIRGEATT